jgi:hypothetical protein
MPLGYEVFAGNSADVTTVETIVTTMESRYRRSKRVGVMDRGMVSEKNLDFLKEGNRRYILGTPKSLLKKFEAELLRSDWHTIQAVAEIKLSASPDGDSETFILCRSRDRAEKDLAIARHFEQRIGGRLTARAERCQKQQRDPLDVSREVGRLHGQNTRASRLFDICVETTIKVLRNSPGKKPGRLSVGPRSRPAPTCSTPTSPIGPMKTCGVPAFDWLKPKSPTEFTKATWNCGPPGNPKNPACGLASWSTSWRSYSGKRWPPCTSEPALAANPVVCSLNQAASA